MLVAQGFGYLLNDFQIHMKNLKNHRYRDDLTVFWTHQTQPLDYFAGQPDHRLALVENSQKLLF